MPFLFCLANTLGTRQPRPMPMSRLAEAMKKPFQVVNRPAMAPRVISQYSTSPTAPGYRFRNMVEAEGFAMWANSCQGQP